MKNFFALLLLICHLNTTMFLPQTAGVNIYDRQGEQQDEINSITEYVSQVLLGRRDDSPEDEDDENNLINTLNTTVYSSQPSYNEMMNDRPVVMITQVFSNHLTYRITAQSADVYSPPPQVIA